MKLTIDKFQKLQSIATLETDEFLKATRLVQVLLDKSEAEIDAMPIKKFAVLCQKLHNAFDIKVNEATMAKPKQIIYCNNKVYHLNFDIKPPFNTGRYIEVLTFSKDDPIINMHNILASICTPMRWSWRKLNFVKQKYDVSKHEEYANDMRQANFKHGYFAMVFFYQVLKASTANTMDCLTAEMNLRKLDKKRVQQLRKVLQAIGGGYSMQSK
jgi:hypothetical protein